MQGVDVWLNTPRRPQEASGTSGEKVLLNGGLNLSILDGWWAEAYDGLNGFAIGNGVCHVSMAEQDRRDAESLYHVLENEVVPSTTARTSRVCRTVGSRYIKRAIRTLGWRFNTDRMVRDYVRRVLSALGRRAQLRHAEVEDRSRRPGPGAETEPVAGVGEARGQAGGVRGGQTPRALELTRLLNRGRRGADILPGHTGPGRRLIQLAGDCQADDALEELRRQKDRIVALAERHGAHNLRVFGSVARGQANPESDVDLVVVPRSWPQPHGPRRADDEEYRGSAGVPG